MNTKLLLASVIVVSAPLAASAADVEVKGAHLCCGACVKAVADELGKVEGISGAKCDREAKTITFKATDAKIARQGARRLMNAGFYGTVSIDGKAIKSPPSGAKEGEKSDKTVVRNMHLCCPLCEKAASGAAKSVKGVTGAEFDRKARTMTVVGTQFDVNAVIAALNKEGMSGRVGEAKKKKKE